MAEIAGKWKSGQAAPKASHCGGQASPKASPAYNLARLQSRPPQRTGRHCGGQATVEYAIVAGVLVAVVAIMSLLLTTFGEYGERVLEMIASDYP